MEKNVIEVNDLVKSYGDFHAVDHLSFTQRDGECLAILGPNGAGKTTTVEILEGFRSPSSGSVQVLGQSPRKGKRQWHAEVGVVLQSVFAASTLTVREEIALGATAYGDPRPVDEVIEMVGLQGKAKQKVGKLSGGQRRRLDVALGIIGRPKLLFLDEPTTGFDPSARHDFWTMIAALHAQGTSVLLTTHYLDEAAFLADRVLVVAGGKKIAEGTPEELGGPQAHLPVVSWTNPTTGVQHRLATENPTEQVVTLSQQFSAGIPDLQVQRPTLEDVYLGLIEGATA